MEAQSAFLSVRSEWPECSLARTRAVPGLRVSPVRVDLRGRPIRETTAACKHALRTKPRFLLFGRGVAAGWFQG